MNCKNCGSDNVIKKSGISKKNNKPWKGLKCSNCGNMEFFNTNNVSNTLPHSADTSNKGNIEILKLAVQISLHGEEGVPIEQKVEGYYKFLEDVLNGTTKPRVNLNEESLEI